MANEAALTTGFYPPKVYRSASQFVCCGLVGKGKADQIFPSFSSYQVPVELFFIKIYLWHTSS